MDPPRNPTLRNAKLQSLLQPLQQQQQHHPSITPISDSDWEMPPPPAYHMIADPNPLIPNMHSPCDSEEEGKEEEEDYDDTPEVNINASTQIRGHGNIISIAQVDTVRIANLISGLLHGSPPSTLAQQALQQRQPTSPGQPQPQAPQAIPQPTPSRRERTILPKINITLNCGATVIGDRNIVGPGLGDIARHMQIAQQRNQALAAHTRQNQMNVNRGTGTNVNVPGSGSGMGIPVYGHTQTSMATPPMSRTSSFGSQGSKRKAEEDVEERSGKRSC